MYFCRNFLKMHPKQRKLLHSRRILQSLPTSAAGSIAVPDNMCVAMSTICASMCPRLCPTDMSANTCVAVSDNMCVDVSTICPSWCPRLCPSDMCVAVSTICPPRCSPLCPTPCLPLCSFCFRRRLACLRLVCLRPPASPLSVAPSPNPFAMPMRHPLLYFFMVDWMKIRNNSSEYKEAQL